MNKIDSIERIKKSVSSLESLLSKFNKLGSLLAETTLNKPELIEVSNEIGELRFEFADNINLSVLAGEFYAKEFLFWVNEGDLKAKSLSKSIESLDSIYKEKFLNFTKAPDYFETLNHLCIYSAYRLENTVLPMFYKTWEEEQKSIAFKLFDEIKSLALQPTRNEIEFNYKRRYSVFRINVLLFLFENDLKCDDNHVHQLYAIKELLNSENYSKIKVCEILIEKSYYLIYKSLNRIDNNEFYLGNDKSDTLYDFKQAKYFKEFYTLSQLLRYNFDDKIESIKLSDVINPVQNFTDLKLSKIHYNNKIIRKKLDSEIDRKVLVKVKKFLISQRDNLLKKITIEPSLFDKISYGSLIILINNNILNVALCEANSKLSELSFKNIKPIVESVLETYNNGKSYQAANNRLNHIGAKKTTKFLLNVLAEIKVDENSFADILFLENSINKLILDLKEQFLWELKSYTLPVYMTFEESIIAYTEGNPNKPDDQSDSSTNEYKLFLDSSYVLPPNYVKTQADINSIVFKYDQLRLKVMVEQSGAIAEGAKNKVQEEVRSSIKSYISTLGIFATIIAFALGSVKVVPDIHSLSHKIAFMVFFGTTLLLFLLSLEFMIVDRNEKSSKNRRLIYSLAVLLALLLYVPFFCGKYKFIDNEVGSQKGSNIDSASVPPKITLDVPVNSSVSNLKTGVKVGQQVLTNSIALSLDSNTADTLAKDKDSLTKVASVNSH